MHHHRSIELVRKISFIRSAEITAPLESLLKLAFCVSLLKHLDCVIVLKPWKRGHDPFELGYVTLELGEFPLSVLENPTNDERYEFFCEVHDVIELGKCDLGFDHPKLGQMSA